MFEKIAVQQQRAGDAENPLDIGFLVEAMLFYGRVNVVANRAALRQLVRVFGPELLLEFLTHQYFKISFERNFTGVMTENSGTPLATHVLTVAEIERQHLFDVLPPLVIDILGRPSRARRLARSLASHIDEVSIDTELRGRVMEDLSSPGYPLSAARTIVETYIQGASFPADRQFDLVPIGEGKFKVETNFDFAGFNRIYHQKIPVTHSSLDAAYILSHIMEARKMLEEAAQSGAELAVSPVYSNLTALKVETALHLRTKSAQNISAFQDLVFDSGRSIADAINTKSRTLHDVLAVLERATQFREWLQPRQPDADLVKEYFRAVTAETWIDKLPSKIMRWSLFTGAGVAMDLLGAGGIGTAGGVLLATADTFLLDRIAKGWKPDQFVNGPLRRFAGES
jgi:hypothetical protein